MQANDFDVEHGSDITKSIVDPTVALVEGFEGAYGLELLATIHWVRANQDPSGGPREIAAQVRNWSERKGRLFTEEHVRRAIERLDANPLTTV